MIELLTGGIAGVAAGLAFNRLTVFQIRKRTDDAQKIAKVNSVLVTLITALISGILFAIIFKLYGSAAKRIEFTAYISIAITIGVVDLDLKKIPNLSVLSLIIIRTAAIIYEMINGGSAKATIIPSLAGLIATFVIFQIPKFIGIPVGTGDVKFASAIGYCLGFFGFLQAAIIMALGLAMLLAYYTVTKKGSLKTKVPMGPFLAMGLIVTLIFPVLTGLSHQIFTR